MPDAMGQDETCLVKCLHAVHGWFYHIWMKILEILEKCSHESRLDD